MTGSGMSELVKVIRQNVKLLIEHNKELTKHNQILEHRLQNVQTGEIKKSLSEKTSSELHLKIDAVVKEIDDCLAELNKDQHTK